METTQNGTGIGNGTGNEELLFSESLPEDLERSGNGLLSLKDIQIRLETDYSRLVRLANAPAIGDLVGAVNVPGAKGVRYEPWAVDVFRRLIVASDAKELTPATAAAWLKLNQDNKNNPDAQLAERSETTITEKAQFGNSTDLATRGLIAVLAPVVSIMQEVRDLLHDFRSGKAQIAAPAAPPQDRLLTAEQAAELLACKPRSVGRSVAPVSESPRRFRESDVLRHIAALAPIEKTRK